MVVGTDEEVEVEDDVVEVVAELVVVVLELLVEVLELVWRFELSSTCWSWMSSTLGPEQCMG